MDKWASELGHVISISSNLANNQPIEQPLSSDDEDQEVVNNNNNNNTNIEEIDAQPEAPTEPTRKYRDFGDLRFYRSREGVTQNLRHVL